MRAAVLKAFGEPLAVQTLPDPTLGTGEIVVDVVAAGVAGYASSIFSGERNYLLELPIVPGPGGIGRVRATGPDATRLSVGDWVFCDATIRSRDDAVNPDSILLGWTARDEAALPLHRYYHNGAYAQRMMLPTENVTPLGDIAPADAGRWCALSQLLVPYGGLAAGDLRPGETVVVNGATGGFGGAGVAVALALGAARVVATGRNQQTLDGLVRRLGPRVRAAAMTGVEEDDRRLIRECAGGPIDFVLDFLPRMATGSQVRAAALAVRPGGRIVLMGGVGGSGGGDLELPYSWLMRHDITVRGKWMYPRDAVPAMIRIARAGLIDLSRFDVVEFGLDEVNEAVAHAAAHPGPLHLTVVRPPSQL
jgi:alcohol dehydrogenase